MYLSIILIIYTIYLALKKNKINILLPITKNKQKTNTLLTSYSHILILINISYLTILINTLICYKNLSLIILNSYLLTILLTLTIFLIFNNERKKYYKYLIITVFIYLLITLILNIFITSSIVYYLSPINIIIDPNDNLLSLISPIIISTILILPIFKK